VSISLLLLTVALSTPLILAAMGGYTSERSGVINIGLEGMMLISAGVTALVTLAAGAWAGVAAGVLAATVLSLLHWLATQKYAVDHVISGMAINALALGGSNFLVGRFGDPGAGTLTGLPLPWYYAVAFVLPFGLWAYTRRTRAGLRMVAVGADPTKARLMGLRPQMIRLGALLATGVFTGLAGAVIVTDARVFTDNMTAGRGFIALAALILGGWRPVPALLACIMFGFFSALRLQLQGTDFLPMVPSEAWAALPYVVTVVALAGFLGKARTPAGLGKP
jgi:general nucleoside transport system permease protein